MQRAWCLVTHKARVDVKACVLVFLVRGLGKFWFSPSMVMPTSKQSSEESARQRPSVRSHKVHPVG